MFVVLTASAIPQHLHGYLSRFLTEVNVGVYVGRITPRVAEGIWQRCSSEDRQGSLTMVVSDSEFEQGFSVRVYSAGQRSVRNLDGVWLGELTQNLQKLE